MPQPKNPARTRSAAAISRSEAWLTRAHILTEALPYMQEYAGAIVVIKCGGAALTEKKARDALAQDVALLHQAGVRPVLVHGGGPQINAMMKRLKLPEKFHDGMRVSDAATVQVVEMVLGSINKQLAHALNRCGARAVGLSGKDANLIGAVRTSARGALGLVGEPQKVEPQLVQELLESGHIPVIAPTAADAQGQTLNINADDAAGHMAAALGAKRFLLLTDVEGVLDKAGNLLTNMSLAEARQLLRDKTAQGGMIPKLRTAIHATSAGVDAAVIVDGRVRHAVLLELFTGHGVGTLIRRTRPARKSQTRKARGKKPRAKK